MRAVHGAGPSNGLAIVVVHASMCPTDAHALPSHSVFRPKIKCDLFPFCAAAKPMSSRSCNTILNRMAIYVCASNLLMQSIRFDFGHLVNFQLLGIRWSRRFRHFDAFISISSQCSVSISPASCSQSSAILWLELNCTRSVCIHI